MMRRILKLSVSLLALAGTGVAAKAADLPPIVELPPEIVTVAAGGWYLRGDIGYAKTKVMEITYFQGANQSGEFETHDIDETWMIGGGIGYQVNDWFRVDWTANFHAETDMIGSSAQNVACSDGTVDAVCTYSDTGTLQYTTVLANSYLDLGTYSGFTPYVGAGIGGAYLHWSDLDNVETHASGPAPTTLAVDVHPKRAGWRFAYGLHAGASYDISERLKVDAGYTFTHITGGEMFGMGITSGLVGTQGYHGDIKSHAFKVGLRYAIN